MQVESHATADNLYEIPHCTICLIEMTEDLANLGCGHVFHLSCITQHFQYRGTCPNCQKRSHEKEIRVVVFPLQKNTEAAKLMRQVLGNLSVEEKEQVQVLFKEVQALTEKSQRLQNKCLQAEKESEKLNSQLNDAKTSLNKTKMDYEGIKKDCQELKKVIEHLRIESKKFTDENFEFRQQILVFKEREVEFEQLKKYRRLMHDNVPQSLLTYKNEMIKKGAPPIDIANSYFDMLLINNLETLKLRNKLDEYPQQLIAKEEEINRLQHSLQRMKKEAKQNREKIAADKKKYDELKQKYKKLIEKYKAKCQELSDDDNYEDSMLSRPSFPLVPTNNLGRQNSSGSGLINSFLNENSSSNIPFPETKMNSKNSENLLAMMMMEEEPQMNARKSQPQKKPAVQKSLNNFFLPTGQKPLMSFGGVKPKIKVEESQKPKPFKNLFD